MVTVLLSACARPKEVKCTRFDRTKASLIREIASYGSTEVQYERHSTPNSGSIMALLIEPEANGREMDDKIRQLSELTG